MEEVLKVLIIDANANSADRIVNTIKSSGFAVRETVVSSKQQLEEAVPQLQQLHIILQSIDVDDLSIADTRSLITNDGHEIPLIALCNNDTNVKTTELLDKGATGVAPADDLDQLKQVTSRIAHTELYIQNLESIATQYNELDQRYNKILDSSRDAICYIHEGLHTYANQSYLDLFGLNDTEEASVLSILELVKAEDQESLKSVLKNISKNHESGTISLHFKTSSDEIQELEADFNPTLVDGEVCAQFIIHAESSESKELQQQLSYLSERDIETGFLHRKSIIDKLQEVIESVNSGQPAHTFIQIDLANIDEIQDRFGVTAIDKLSGCLATALKSACGEEELLAKITDESFGILTSINTEEELIEFGKKIRAVTAGKSVEIKGTNFEPECYLGAVILDTAVDEVSDALSAAKSACDYAWENQLQELYLFPHEPRSLTGTLLDQKWTTELQDAIRDQRLKLLFQPVVSITGQVGDRYQVYTQLVSQEGATISVAEVLPSIERSGVSVMLDRWVITSALQKLADHSAKNPNSLFFIKLTAGSLSDEKFVPWLESQCKKSSVDPFRLVFDIREETIVSHLKEAREFANKLNELGCQVAIDAFGISQDPDKILSMIPANYLKLSFQLMAGLKDGEKDKIDAIRHICDKAKTKNAMIIAQFVESAQILSNAWSLNIDFVSGDFFQKPLDSLEYDFSSAA